MKILIVLIILLLIILCICCLNSKYKVDNFMEFSCEAIQNKYYQIEELLHKSQCPNLVIVEKRINNRPAFFAEFGDQNGPFFSSDYARYYYLGVSPDGIQLDLDYDLYYYPWYNPRRWFHGREVYYPRRRHYWKDHWYRPWDKYRRRINKQYDYDYDDDDYNYNKRSRKSKMQKSKMQKSKMQKSQKPQIQKPQIQKPQIQKPQIQKPQIQKVINKMPSLKDQKSKVISGASARLS